jgi:hypothetical protein
MDNLKLDIDDLMVDTFATAEDMPDGRGTVVGQGDNLEEPEEVTAPFCSLPICLPTGVCPSFNICITQNMDCYTEGDYCRT